jgi:hypothetical protein
MPVFILYQQLATAVCSCGIAAAQPDTVGVFTDGPASVPGRPGILAASCSRTDKLCGLIAALEPSPDPGWTEAPSSSPGRPGIPAPEFCVLGIEISGALVRAITGSAVMVSANMIALIIFIFVVMATSVAASPLPRNVPTPSAFRRYTNLRCFTAGMRSTSAMAGSFFDFMIATLLVKAHNGPYHLPSVTPL